MRRFFVTTAIRKKKCFLEVVDNTIKFTFKLFSSRCVGSMNIEEPYEKFNEIINFLRKILYHYPDVNIDIIDRDKLTTCNYKIMYFITSQDKYENLYF